MSLAEALNKPYFEVASWPAIEILRWQVWATYREQERQKAKAEALSGNQ